MTDPSQVIATVVDNGLFCDFALNLAPHFKKLFYWTPWESSFPKSNSLLPGDGFDQMERVRDKWTAIRQSQLVIYFDVYYGAEQELVESLGKFVWGSRRGESLELDRMSAKQILREHGVQPSEATGIEGLENLRVYLQEHDEVWVKVSTVRGDFETFKSRNYQLSEPKLDELEHKLGAKKLIARFVVEPDISPAVEWGIDAFTIDGQWPRRTFSGVEVKDLGFIGKVMEWEAIPAYLRQPNEALSEWFKAKRYRGFFSTELRITEDRQTYLIDPCCRLPSPPNEIQQMMFDNWPEIILAGAQGEMIEPNAVHQYGVCAMIHSSWADKNWQAVKFPEAVRPWVKLRNHCQIDGTDYVVPQEVGLPEIGAVVGVGDTLDEAIEHLETNAPQVEGYYVEIKLDAIQTAMEERQKAASVGIKI